MEQWADKVAVVTGATSGIGQNVAIQLVKHKIKVVGLGRQIDRLNELKAQLVNEPGQFYPIVCDVTEHDNIVKTIDWIKKNLGDVDILINSAGIGPEFVGFCDSSVESWKKILATNVLGLTMMTQEVVKSMIERKVAGHIININSIVGHKVPTQIVNMLNIYAASKYAVTGVTETLRLELVQNKSKIKVTSISPSITNTNFCRSPKFLDKITNMLAITALEVSDVTDAILYALSTRPGANVTEMIIQATEEPM